MKRHATRLGFLTTLLLGGLSLSTMVTAAPFDPLIKEQDGWKQSDWFGWYMDAHYPLVRHLQHGWVYVVEAADGMYLWDYTLNEWFLTSSGIYPIVYEFYGDNWLWYYEGTGNPRWYRDLVSEETYTEYNGMLMPDMIRRTFESAVTLSDDAADANLDQAMQDVMGLALLPLLGDPATSTCPVITRTPAEINLFALPAQITARADFGSGCAPSEDLGLLSGALDIGVFNLVLGETAIGMDLELIAENVARNGEALMDGMLSAGVSVSVNASESETATHYVTQTALGISAELTFTELEVGGFDLEGAAVLTGNLVTVEQESIATWEETETMEGTLSLSLDGLTMPDMVINSGTVDIMLDFPGTSRVTADLQTSEGPATMVLEIIASEDGNQMELRTVGVADVMGYTLEIRSLLFDSSQCPDYPVGGEILLGWDGALYIFTFSPNCDGSYSVTRG